MSSVLFPDVSWGSIRSLKYSGPEKRPCKIKVVGPNKPQTIHQKNSRFPSENPSRFLSVFNIDLVSDVPLRFNGVVSQHNSNFRFRSYASEKNDDRSFKNLNTLQKQKRVKETSSKIEETDDCDGFFQIDSYFWI